MIRGRRQLSDLMVSTAALEKTPELDDDDDDDDGDDGDDDGDDEDDGDDCDADINDGFDMMIHSL